MEQQWIVKSLTIWGLIIAILTAVLPLVGTMFPDLGEKFTPEWLANLDANVRGAITGAGVLIGSGLVLFDRIKGAGEPKKSLTWTRPTERESWED